MVMIPQASLFSWKEIEASTDLDWLDLVLSVIPDESLMQTLKRARGKGRNDYPIRAMWNALLAGVVFLYPSAAALVRELRRNRELAADRAFMGFEKDRKMLKFRCPAADYGFDCRGRTPCENGRDTGAFGRVVRVPFSLDRRIFTPSHGTRISDRMPANGVRLSSALSAASEPFSASTITSSAVRPKPLALS